MKSNLLVITAICITTFAAPAVAGDSPGKEVLPPIVADQAEKRWSFDTLLLWDSKYISEGRNNLEEGGLLSVESVFTVDDLSLGVWYADSYETSYNEINLMATYAVEFSGFVALAGYTYLIFPDDDADDHELSAGVAYEAFPYLIPAVEYVYSVESEGSFIEISLASELAVTDLLTLTPYLMVGINAGYMVNEHEGFNNVQVGLQGELSLTENLAVIGYAAHTWGLDEQPGDTLIDEFWGGAGLALSF